MFELKYRTKDEDVVATLIDSLNNDDMAIDIDSVQDEFDDYFTVTATYEDENAYVDRCTYLEGLFPYDIEKL